MDKIYNYIVETTGEDGENNVHGETRECPRERGRESHVSVGSKVKKRER